MSINLSFNPLKPNIKSQLIERFANRVLFDVSVAPFVSYKIGGPSDVLVFPTSEEEIAFIYSLAKSDGIPVTIIGSGTNLLVTDKGIRGITISLAQAFNHIIPKSTTVVQCGGGVLKPDLLEWSISKELSGLEFSSGVPGTIGGGIFMNAGTKYGSYGDILLEVRLFNSESGFRTFKREDLFFGYRTSQVQNSIVVWASFQLKPGKSVFIRQEVNRIIQERAEKQPLDFPSCGSTFKNPEGYSAGRLIEKAGLKGITCGGAEISLKHANFILNKQNATARDILTLIDIIKKQVFQTSGVSLECEVVVLGEE